MVTTRSSTKETHGTEKKAASRTSPKAQIIPPSPRSTKASHRNVDNLLTESTIRSHEDQIESRFKADTLKKMYYLLSRLSSSSSTICPSQIARGLNKDAPARYPDWRAMMDDTRAVVWDEVRKGAVQVTQGGQVREYEERNSLKGPIRVRRGPKWKADIG